MRLRPVGERGLLVELDSAEAVEALYAELLRRSPPAREIVPAARTVLLTGLADARRFAEELARWRIPPAGRAPRGTVEIPVRYDGPDLAEVAAAWGVAPREAARLHAATAFHVAFCGFAPGFGYLTGLPERYHVPRRTDPRKRVPAGSVALAGAYSGVYPRSSPGGWRIIGTTRAVLWDAGREPAALLTPGTEVRFVPEAR